MADKLKQIIEIIGTDNELAENVIEYCNTIQEKTFKNKMKSFVLENINKSYDTAKIKEYLDSISDISNEVDDRSYDCHHEITVKSGFMINNITIDFYCEQIEDDGEDGLSITINDNKVINDICFPNEVCMLKQHKIIKNFNFQHYKQLYDVSEKCTHYGWVSNTEFDDIIQEYNKIVSSADEFIDYDIKKEEEFQNRLINLELFVEICEKCFTNINPIEMFDVIMLCLIYCYKYEE